MVTLRSCIASSSAAWVFGGVRLISSASSSSQKIGPRVRVKVEVWKLNRLEPMMSPGIRSGVNWMRPNSQPERAGEALGEEGLGRARRALQQHVAAGHQRGQHQLDGVGLTDHRLADLAAHAVGEVLHVTDVHASSPVSIGRAAAASAVRLARPCRAAGLGVEGGKAVGQAALGGEAIEEADQRRAGQLARRADARAAATWVSAA